jgi:hypothetical protein
VQALRNDTHISSIDLGFNQIDDTGATAVARLLGETSILSNINLECVRLCVAASNAAGAAGRA